MDEAVAAGLIVASAALYAAGLRVLWRRAGRGQGVRKWQAASFAAGLFVLSAALLSPLSERAERLLSAHMTQHELLMLVAAPLVVFGRPLFVWMWALPVRGRDAAGRLVRTRAVSRGWRTLTAPLTAASLHALALWGWHAPRLYQAALHSEAVHALEHLCFFLTAVLFW